MSAVIRLFLRESIIRRINHSRLSDREQNRFYTLIKNISRYMRIPNIYEKIWYHSNWDVQKTNYLTHHKQQPKVQKIFSWTDRSIHAKTILHKKALNETFQLMIARMRVLPITKNASMFCYWIYLVSIQSLFTFVEDNIIKWQSRFIF